MMVFYSHSESRTRSLILEEIRCHCSINIARTQLQHLQSDWLWKQMYWRDSYRLWVLYYLCQPSWVVGLEIPGGNALGCFHCQIASQMRKVVWNIPVLFGLVIKLQSPKLFRCELFSQRISWDLTWLLTMSQVTCSELWRNKKVATSIGRILAAGPSIEPP